MKLYLAKPDLTYFEQYNDMMREWIDSNSQIAPWFLDKPLENIEEYAKLVQWLDECENANQDKAFCSATSFFVIDENGRLVGATSLRHYLTIEGFNTWGHIGYGVRPSERRKGYATQMLKLTLDEARNKKMYNILIAAHKSNIGSCKVIENCHGVLENTVEDPNNNNELINRYWINNRS